MLRRKGLVLAAVLAVTSGCGGANGGTDGPSGPSATDTVLALANVDSGANAARLFRWTAGKLEEVHLPPLDDSLALAITWASPTDAWLSVRSGGASQLLHSGDRGRTFAPSGIELPAELQRSTLFDFTGDAIWTARIEDVFVGSAGELPLATSLWASADAGRTWQQRWRFGGFGVQTGVLRFARRGERDEVYFTRAGESEPPMLLDLATGAREAIETSPFLPTHYASAGARGFLAGTVPSFPDPDLPAIASARPGEAWTVSLLGDAPSPAPVPWVLDFVDEQHGIVCGLRRDGLVVRGIGCFQTRDGGTTWEFRAVRDGSDLEVDDVAYTGDGDIVLAARTDVGPRSGPALLLVGREEGGDWHEYTLVGSFAAQLARSSAARAR